MQDRVWNDLLDRLEDKFGDINIQKTQETRSDDIGNEIVSNISFVEFEMPEGKFRVEKVVTPMILDKKTHYSHGSGNNTSVEYVLSETETTSKIRVLTYNDDLDDWSEIKTNNFSF
jgi:hypothetical protein